MNGYHTNTGSHGRRAARLLARLPERSLWRCSDFRMEGCPAKEAIFEQVLQRTVEHDRAVHERLDLRPLVGTAEGGCSFDLCNKRLHPTLSRRRVSPPLAVTTRLGCIGMI